MNQTLTGHLGAKLLVNLDKLLKQGKDDSVLVLFNAITERILAGGWRGECSFMVDEFKVRKVRFVDSCNLELVKEAYRVDANSD